MRVLVYPADLAGCGYYRLIFAANHLKSLGHDIIIEWPGKGTGFEIYLDENNNLLDFNLPHEGIDVLVMQRVSHDWHIQAIPLIQSRGIAVVIDMDDDLSSIHRHNVAYWNYHPGNKGTPYSWKNTEQICRDAAFVTVSTKNLMKVYAKHGRGQVIDNYVPERYLDIQPVHEDEPVFGWAGTVQSHPTDLQVCGRAVQTLIDQGHKFRVIGPKNKIKEHLRLNQEPDHTGVVLLQNWPTVISQLNVGMAPLESSLFNSSKSRLKVLELNSVGVPYVASPRQEYRKYHQECGAGILADTPKEWIRGISELMTNDARRKELSEQGRAYVATQTIEENSWRWWEAWTRAYEYQRTKK